MMLLTTAITIGLAAQAFAQTTTPTQEQWDAITSDLASQYTSLTDSPQLSSLVSAIQSDTPVDILDNIGNVLDGNPLPSVGIPYSLLTETPSISWGPWSTYIPASDRSLVESFATSVGRVEQSILTKDLSFTEGKAAATASSESSMAGSGAATTTASGAAATSSPAPGSDARGLQVGWVMGVGVGAVGLVAALL